MNELQIDAERPREVCQRHGVVHLDVFGSVARGEADADNDIDLLHVISPQARLGFGIFDLENESSEIFGRKWHQPIAKRNRGVLVGGSVDEGEHSCAQVDDASSTASSAGAPRWRSCRCSVG